MTTTNPTPTQPETLEPPRWTVCYNIVSPESDAWVGRGWEFFNKEREAEECYRRHQRLGNVPTKRPFYNPVDLKYLGVVDQRRLDARRAADAGPPNEELRSACCDAPTRTANTDYNVCTACKEACDTVTAAPADNDAE